MRIRLLIVLLSLLILPHATAWSQESLVPTTYDMPSLLSASDSVAPSTQEPLPSFEKQALRSSSRRLAAQLHQADPLGLPPWWRADLQPQVLEAPYRLGCLYGLLLLHHVE